MRGWCVAVNPSLYSQINDIKRRRVLLLISTSAGVFLCGVNFIVHNSLIFWEIRLEMPLSLPKHASYIATNKLAEPTVSQQMNNQRRITVNK
jgi:hypothetical protein